MNSHILRTLRARLVASHLLVSLAGILLLSAFAVFSIFNTTRDRIRRAYDDQLLAAARELEGPVQEFLAGDGSDGQVREVADRWFSYIPGLRYAVYRPDGTLLAAGSASLPSEFDPADDSDVQQALSRESGEGRRIQPDAQGVQTLYLTKRIGGIEGPLAFLRLEIPVEDEFAVARRALVPVLLADLAIVIGAGLFAYILAGRLSDPITELTEAAEGLSQGELGLRIDPPGGPQELNRLAEALNTMAARLQGNVDELRTFVANASHELRTPLTSVKLRVEALRSGALDDAVVTDRFLSEIESEVDRLGRMVNDLLDLSRIEAGLAPKERAPLDLSIIAEEVRETFSTRAERMGIKLSLSRDHGLPRVQGNEDQLRRMLSNLVDNAIKFTAQGGKVDIALEPGEHGDCVRLMVKDTGLGIDPKHLSHIFERFYRIEATRPRHGPPQGSGLGLSIAKSIVETHGGKIAVTSQIGEGTTFLVELPVYNE
jgi:signal transduction histidine kinase